MRRIIVVAGVASLLALGACAGPEDIGSSNLELAAYQGGPDLPLCHWIAGELRGKQASIWKVKDFTDLLAVQLEDQIVCFDSMSQAIELGMTAIPPVVTPSCDVCEGVNDGTPMPADQFNAAARSHSVDRSQL